MTFRRRSCLCTVVLFLSLSMPAQAAERIRFWLNSFEATELAADLCRTFTRQTGIEVDIHYIDGPLYKPELIKHALDDEAPDVALFPADFLAMDKELHFSEIPVSAMNKDLLKEALQTGQQGGALRGAPVYWGNHLMLYYNRSLVKTPISRFEDLERQAPAFKARDIVPLQYPFGEMYSLVPFMAAYGGWPLDDDDRPTLDTPATAQALNFIFSQVDKGLIRKDCHDECAHIMFREGRSAYLMGGDWMYGRLIKELGPRLGVALLPSIGGKPMVSMYSSYVLAFPQNGLDSEKRGALLKFMAFMQSPATQTRWAREANLFPVDSKVFKAYVGSAPPDIKIMLKQLKRSRAMSNHRNMAFAWAGMSRGFSMIYNGRATPTQAAELMQKSTESAARRAPQ